MNGISCPHCGRGNTNTRDVCGYCGKALRPLPGLRKMSLLRLIVLTMITLGVYWPVWLYTSRHAINTLRSQEKLGDGAVLFVVASYGIALVLGFSSGLLAGAGDVDTAELLASLSSMFNVMYAVTLLVQSLKVRRILAAHFNTHLSRIATFFFQIYYLQHSINRLLQEDTTTDASRISTA